MPTLFRNIPVAKACIPFIMGLYVADTFLLDFNQVTFILFLALISIAYNLLLRHYPFTKSVAILSAFFFAGILHYNYRSPLQHPTHFSKNKDAKFLIARISDFNQLSNSLRAVAEVNNSGTTKGEVKKSTGKLMLYIKGAKQKDFKVGSKWILPTNYFEEKENTNPHVYNYKEYLNYRGIYHRMYVDDSDIAQIDSGNNNVRNISTQIRNKCLDHLDTLIKKENSIAVAAAMILGHRNLLTDDLYSAYTNTGTVHILAVSGLHVGIVSYLVFLLLNRIKGTSTSIKLTKLIVSLCAVWGFAMITGLGAAVIRASVMFSLIFAAKLFNRNTNFYNILAIAALLMLIYNPYYLFQAGFQFSFLALLSIVVFYPKIYAIGPTSNMVTNVVWQMISVSLSAQILVSPLAIFYFHKLPTYFWLTGILAIPVAYLVLYIGLATLCCAFILGTKTLATIYLSTCLETIIELFNSFIFMIEKLPYSSADNLWLSQYSLAIIYLALLGVLLFFHYQKVRFLIATISLLIVQSLIHAGENFHLRSKSNLFVYDIYNDSVIDYMSNGSLTTITTGIKSNKQIDYICKNNRLYYRNKETKPINKNGEITNNNSFYLIKDKLIVLYPDEEILKYKSSKPVDLLVLSGNSFQNLEKLSTQFTIKQIVIDGTVRTNKYKLSAKAKKLNIALHATSTDGCYIYNFL